VYRTLAGLLATLAAGLLLAVLSFSASARKPANVRFVNGVEPDTLDPDLLTGQPGGRIASALFEGLTRPEASSLRAAPGVASSWEISDDGLRYTFHLRDDSYWTDGKQVTAADFVYSWRRLLDPKLGAEYAYMLHSVRGARAFNTFEALARTIDKQLIVALEQTRASAGSAGLSSAEWRALATRLPLHDSLQHSEDADLRSLLDSPPNGEERVSAERLARFQSALRSEVERLRSVARDVGSRFGESLGVYAEGEHTLVVELEAPTPYFLDVLSFYPALPVPRQVVERYGSAWFLPETVVSNGPFVLESWRVNDRIRLRRNERYWGRSEVRADSIEALPTENTTTALNLYLTGEVDWLPAAYPLDLVDQLRQRPDFYMHPAFVVYYYRFNTRRPPFNDVRVREALNLAIDRRVITEQVLGLGQLPANHFVPPGVPGYTPPASHIQLDIERARRLLSEAGYPEGRGFPAAGILYNTLEAHKKIAEVVSDQLRRNLGIQVGAYNQEWQSYLTTTRAGNFDLSRGSWIGDYLDPNTFLDMWVTNGGNNQTGFSSSKYDAIIRAAANMEAFAARPDALLRSLKEPGAISELLRQRTASANLAQRRELLDRARMKLLAEAEAILVQDEFPVLPVYFYVESGLHSPGLRGVYTELEQPDGTHVPNLRGIHPLRDIWFDGGQH
jgi:oligopeptide transport system substrate-binding protein